MSAGAEVASSSGNWKDPSDASTTGSRAARDRVGGPELRFELDAELRDELPRLPRFRQRQLRFLEQPPGGLDVAGDVGLEHDQPLPEVDLALLAQPSPIERPHALDAADL